VKLSQKKSKATRNNKKHFRNKSPSATDHHSGPEAVDLPPFTPDPHSARDRLILFFVSWLFFLINLKYPINRNFDEFHYVPSAYQWLELMKNQNWEHPPLAKQLMTFGLMLFGDDPIGWRFSSTLFGALTLVGIHGAAETLFRSRKAAFICFFLSFFNQLIYVQSRIAMLDTFMMAFLSAGFWFALRAVYERREFSRFYLTISGVFMGLAICSKWFSLIPYFIGTSILLFKLYESRRHESFRRNVVTFFWGWGAVAVITYYIPFILYFFVDRTPPFRVAELLWDFQWSMLSGQKSVTGNHPYASQWWSWPLMLRPIWYAFDADGETKQWIRGVVLLGNPAIMWGGLLAILYSAIRFFKTKSRLHFLMLSLYFGCLFSWALIPRKLAFYYYYYPNGILLSFFLTTFFLEMKKPKWTIAFSAVAVGFFIYFFPILGALRIPAGGLGFYMWFRNWI
jgi:dolichyl-phosphate-mannose-protein mannosyltransferase